MAKAYQHMGLLSNETASSNYLPATFSNENFQTAKGKLENISIHYPHKVALEEYRFREIRSYGNSIGNSSPLCKIESVSPVLARKSDRKSSYPERNSAPIHHGHRQTPSVNIIEDYYSPQNQGVDYHKPSSISSPNSPPSPSSLARRFNFSEQTDSISSISEDEEEKK